MCFVVLIWHVFHRDPPNRGSPMDLQGNYASLAFEFRVKFVRNLPFYIVIPPPKSTLRLILFEYTRVDETTV